VAHVERESVVRLDVEQSSEARAFGVYNSEDAAAHLNTTIQIGPAFFSETCELGTGENQ